MIITKNDDINYVIAALLDDDVVLLPTETVYGLGCKYDSKIGHSKIMSLKNRPVDKTLPICVGSYKQITKIAKLSLFQRKAIRKLLPGPITVILRAKNMPEYLTKNGTIAVRYSDDKWLSKVIRKLNSPICLTSANLSGQEPFKNIEEATITFSNRVAVYVDDKLVDGIPSTIVDLTTKELKILREGPISKEEILKRINHE